MEAGSGRPRSLSAADECPTSPPSLGVLRQSPSHMVVKMAENGAFLSRHLTCAPPFIRSLPSPSFVIVVSDGNETATALLQQEGRRDSLSPHSSHFCSAPKLTCRRRRPFSPLWTVVCHVGNCRFQRHSSARSKYLGTYRWRATAFHDICCPAAGTALSIAKGQMGEKPCSGSPSLFLPSRLLRPPSLRLLCTGEAGARKKPFTHCITAAGQRLRGRQL